MKGSANILGGELVLKVLGVHSDKFFVRPTVHSVSMFNKEGNPSNDLSMRLENNKFLHICGDNDWAFLALQLLEPIKDEAKRITKLVQDRKADTPTIKAVMLGKNDKRIMDVYFGGKGKCERILGLPVIVTDELNEVTFLVEDTNCLPFS